MRIADGPDEDVREGFAGVWRAEEPAPRSTRAAEQNKPRKVGRSTGPGDQRRARDLASFRAWLASLRPTD